MALGWVSEFTSIPLAAGVSAGAARQPELVASQKVNYGAGSTQSNPFSATTKVVRLTTDTICSVKFGLNPTAGLTDLRMNANSVEYFAVNAGDKVAFIANP